MNLVDVYVELSSMAHSASEQTADGRECPNPQKRMVAERSGATKRREMANGGLTVALLGIVGVTVCSQSEEQVGGVVPGGPFNLGGASKHEARVFLCGIWRLVNVLTAKFMHNLCLFASRSA